MHIPRKISTLDFDNWPAKYLLTEKVTKVLGKAESLLVVKLDVTKPGDAELAT